MSRCAHASMKGVRGTGLTSLPETAFTEEALSNRAMAGDDAAYRALVQPHLRLFTGGIHRILQDDQQTQEALENALLSIHGAMRHFKGAGRFPAWAYLVCLNEALMRRRHAMRRTTAQPWAQPFTIDPEQGRRP